MAIDKFDAIIFDFDGTLFQTEKLVIPAFDKTFNQLEEDGYIIEKKPTEQQMLSVIGMTLDEIWKRLLPDLPSDAHLKANDYMLKNELEGVKEGYGALYPGVVETLLDLKNKGYRLFIASNGLEDYIKGITRAFRIDHFFDSMYSAGQYKTERKSDLIRILINENDIKKGIMVGDRISDVEGGATNNLHVIGCDFGFASREELQKADIIIEKFAHLIDVI